MAVTKIEIAPIPLSVRLHSPSGCTDPHARAHPYALNELGQQLFGRR